MAVDKTPVLKRCRSLGLSPSVLGYDKKSNKQTRKSNKKLSGYGLQLREKQKAKFIYGVLERPFSKYYEKATKMSGQTGENLMTILESRLDNVVYRMALARTRKEARQMVDHKYIAVNGKTVNIPSYLVKAGDVIEVREKFKTNGRLKEIVEANGAKVVPDWLDCDRENMKATVKALPKRDEILDIPVQETLIVELYSKC